MSEIQKSDEKSKAAFVRDTHHFVRKQKFHAIARQNI